MMTWDRSNLTVRVVTEPIRPHRARVESLPPDHRCRDCGETRYTRAPGAWLPTGCRCDG